MTNAFFSCSMLGLICISVVSVTVLFWQPARNVRSSAPSRSLVAHTRGKAGLGLSNPDASSAAAAGKSTAGSVPPYQLRIAPVSLTDATVQNLLAGATGVYTLGWVDSSATPAPAITCVSGCTPVGPTPSPTPKPTPPGPPTPRPTPGPPTPRPTPPGPAGSWTKHSGKNCYAGNGAVDLESPPGSTCGEMSLKECEAKCNELPACEGITINNASDSTVACYRRGSITLSQCIIDDVHDTWTKDKRTSTEDKVISIELSAPAQFPTCNGIFLVECAWAGSMWLSYVEQVTFYTEHPVLQIGSELVTLNLPSTTVIAAVMYDACMAPNEGGSMNCFPDVNNYKVMGDRLTEINQTSPGGINFIVWGGDNGYGRNMAWNAPGNLPQVYQDSLGGLDFLTIAPVLVVIGNHEYDQDVSHGCSTMGGTCTNIAGAAPYVAFGMTSSIKPWYSNPSSLCHCTSSACSNPVFYEGITQPVDWKYTTGFYAIGSLGVIVVDGRWHIGRLLQQDTEFKAAFQAGLESMRTAGVLQHGWVLSHWNGDGQGGGRSARETRSDVLQFAKTSLSPPISIGTDTWHAVSGHAHVNVPDAEQNSWVIGGNGQAWGASGTGCGCASKMAFGSNAKTTVDWTSPGGKCATHCTPNR